MAQNPPSSELSVMQSLAMFLPVSEKLTCANHPLWKAQVIFALKGAHLLNFISPSCKPPKQFVPPKEGTDSKEPPVVNPEYETWVAKDRLVLNYLLTNMSKELLSQVNTETSAVKAWAAIEGLVATQSRAWNISTRMALAMTSKGSSTVSEYFTKMKGLADEMASAGRKLEDEALVSYILRGLDLEFDPIVSAVTTRVEPITVGELFTQLTSFEQRQEIKGGGNNNFQLSANLATKGGRSGGSNNNHGGRGGFGRGGQGHGQRGGHVGQVAVEAVLKEATFRLEFSANFVGKKDMPSSGALRGLTPLSLSRPKNPPPLQQHRTGWIQTGIWIPGQLITSLVILTG